VVELGKIEKPEVKSFSGKRKLYCVPSVYPLKGGDDEYNKLISKYWEEVVQEIEKLELAGKIKKIFCESICAQGDEALRVLAAVNERAHTIVKRKVKEGALFLPLEKKEIFRPFRDWANCLGVVKTKWVYVSIVSFYMEVYNRRLEHIQNVIEINVEEGEAALLIIADEDLERIRFPRDMEVFLVSPPSYNDILRWLRDKMKERKGTG
jgi:hypothetical protein